MSRRSRKKARIAAIDAQKFSITNQSLIRAEGERKQALFRRLREGGEIENVEEMRLIGRGGSRKFRKLQALRARQEASAQRERHDPEYAKKLREQWDKNPRTQEQAAQRQRQACGRRIRKAREKAAQFLARCKELAADHYRFLPYGEYLQTEYWRTVRQIKLIEAGHRCEKCGSGRQRSLQVHHTSYDYRGREHEALMMLRVLCDNCHKKEHGLA